MAVIESWKLSRQLDKTCKRVCIQRQTERHMLRLELHRVKKHNSLAIDLMLDVWRSKLRWRGRTWKLRWRQKIKTRLRAQQDSATAHVFLERKRMNKKNPENNKSNENRTLWRISRKYTHSENTVFATNATKQGLNDNVTYQKEKWILSRKVLLEGNARNFNYKHNLKGFAKHHSYDDWNKWCSRNSEPHYAFARKRAI